MTKEQILEYIIIKLEKLRKEKELMLDKMLESKKIEEDENLRIEYLKSLYAYEQMLDVKAFIETGVNLDYEFKKEK